MVKQPSNKQVKQRKETSATARRRFPPAPRLPDTRTTPATYMACSEAGSATYLADTGCGKSDAFGLQNSVARGGSQIASFTCAASCPSGPAC